MPTYQYRCTECDHEFEEFQSFTDDALTVCPACGGRLRKVFNAVGVVFKGSGFYRTDSRTAEFVPDVRLVLVVERCRRRLLVRQRLEVLDLRLRRLVLGQRLEHGGRIVLVDLVAPRRARPAPLGRRPRADPVERPGGRPPATPTVEG